MGRGGEASAVGSVRDLNRERIVGTLRLLGVTSRAELARRTGLSRATVSSIVSDLRESGLIQEHVGPDPASAQQAGRPPALIKLHNSAGAALGIDFGKRHITAAVANLSHEILAERTRAMAEGYDPQDGVAVATALVDDVLTEAGTDRALVLGVGMGLPGPLRRDGSVVSSTILPGWETVQAAEEMSQRLSLPAYVENDANLGALAEFTWGAGQGAASVVYLKIATGIGAGLVIDGRLFRGAGGTAGEIGHTMVDEDGEICRCGNRGCLETVAGAPAIVRLLRRTLGDGLEPQDVLERAAAGDLGARRALGDAARYVGVAVANLCNLVNPERIVVGGSIGCAGEVMLEPLRESVRLRAIPSAAEDVEIVSAELGERAELLGALALVLHQTSRTTGTREPAAAAS